MLDPISTYHAKINTINQEITHSKKMQNHYSYLRVILFLTEIIILICFSSETLGGLKTFVHIGIVVPIVIFIYIMRLQANLDHTITSLEKILGVYQNEYNVLYGLPNSYDNGQRFESGNHPYSADLDIFGRESLYAQLNRCMTAKGNDILSSKLTEVPITIDQILARQDAIEELKDCIEETFFFRASLLHHEAAKFEQIKMRLGSDIVSHFNFTDYPGIKNLVKAMPYLFCSIVLFSSWLGPAAWYFLFTLLFINILLTAAFNRKISKIFIGFSNSSKQISEIYDCIKWIEGRKWISGYIQAFSSVNKPVGPSIQVLHRIIKNFEVRFNVTLWIVLNAIFLWDLKWSIELAIWQRSSSGQIVAALDQISDFEELISFSTLRYNHPTWVFPNVVEDFNLTTKSIGHPLIKPEKRVLNDFQILGNPTLDIITGSNMAGKSTFLRTLGVNMVLAYSGSPVCADAMCLSLFSINTYMRIKDSLGDETSTFKAELNRLEMILKNTMNSSNTFVLIDEMLRGTNSKDKYLGSKVFSEKLIKERTPGLIATHDLQLADLSVQYPGKVRNFHFDMSITDGTIRFDYELKEGPCKSFNAAFLLQQIGLSI